MRCAVEMQDHLASGGSPLRLHVGLNLGDVIVGVETAEIERAKYKPTESLDAYPLTYGAGQVLSVRQSAGHGGSPAVTPRTLAEHLVVAAACPSRIASPAGEQYIGEFAVVLPAIAGPLRPVLGAWLRARCGRTVQLEIGNRPHAGPHTCCGIRSICNQYLRECWRTNSMHVGLGLI